LNIVATAEDRLDQVLLLYLGVKGELAAAFGPGPIGADKVGPPDTWSAMIATALRVWPWFSPFSMVA
jgi:acyl-homoserine lactone acylase PvdQ